MDRGYLYIRGPKNVWSEGFEIVWMKRFFWALMVYVCVRRGGVLEFDFRDWLVEGLVGKARVGGGGGGGGGGERSGEEKEKK